MLCLLFILLLLLLLLVLLLQPIFQTAAAPEDLRCRRAALRGWGVVWTLVWLVWPLLLFLSVRIHSIIIIIIMNMIMIINIINVSSWTPGHPKKQARPRRHLGLRPWTSAHTWPTGWRWVSSLAVISLTLDLIIVTVEGTPFSRRLVLISPTLPGRWPRRSVEVPSEAPAPSCPYTYYIYIYIYICISLSLSIYIYIYIYIVEQINKQINR